MGSTPDFVALIVAAIANFKQTPVAQLKCDVDAAIAQLKCDIDAAVGNLNDAAAVKLKDDIGTAIAKMETAAVAKMESASVAKLEAAAAASLRKGIEDFIAELMDEIKTNSWDQSWKLMERLEDLTRRLDFIEQRINPAAAEILTKLDATVAKLGKDVAALVASRASMPASRPRQLLPELEELAFHIPLHSWITSAKAKLQIDGVAIGGHKAQFLYLRARVSEKYKDLLLPQLQAAQAGSGDWNPKNIFTTFEADAAKKEALASAPALT